MPRPRKATSTANQTMSKLLLPYMKASEVKKDGLYLEYYSDHVNDRCNTPADVKVFEVVGDWAIDLSTKQAIPVSALQKNDKACKYVFLGPSW